MSKTNKETESYESDILEPMAYLPDRKNQYDDGMSDGDETYRDPADYPEDDRPGRPQATFSTAVTDRESRMEEERPHVPTDRRRRVSANAKPLQQPERKRVVESDNQNDDLGKNDLRLKEEQRKAERRARQSTKFLSLTDRRFAIFGGVLLIIMAAYLLLVTVSYYFQGGVDQSVISNANAIDRALHGGHAEVKNAGGVVGAWLAEVLMSQWLGLGSFILIFYLGAVGLSLVRVKPFKFWNLTSRCLSSAVALSVVMGLFSVSMADWTGTYVYPGGLHGHEINRMLVDLAGWWGALAVSLVLITLVAMLFFNDLKAAYAVYRKKLEEHRAHRAERRAERERVAALEAEERENQRKVRETEMKRRDEERREKERVAEEQRQRLMTAARDARNGGSTDDFDAEETNGTSGDSTVETSTVAVVASGINENVTPSVDAGKSETPVEIEDEDDFGPESRTTIEQNIDKAIGNDKEDPVSERTEDTDTDVEFVVDKPVIQPADDINDSEAYDPTAELSNFHYPSIDLLIDRQVKENSLDETEQEGNKARITKTLGDYGIPISSIKATVGPTVTLYEIVPAEGVKIAKIKRLEDDIALSLAALGIRIIAPIPGRGTIGIEVPNKDPQTVSIRSILSSRAFQETKCILPMAMGCTISNEVFIADLTKMPHLLVAGATGMGKSVGLNTIIASLLYKKHPAELKFVLIDPKMVEFTLYNKLERHYLAKLPDEDEAIITDVHKAVATLNSLLIEMESRYSLLKDAGKRNIVEYNTAFVARTLNPDKGHRFLPYIVVVVDEFADLIMQVGKEVETPIARLAQKARAVGIHVILATQRPSTDVITGVIKANFPGRIAFRVFQMVDSRTILDRPGANQLIGRGDMLFSTGGRVERIQCAFIDTPEVEAMCDAINSQAGYPCPYELPEYVPEENDAAAGGSASAGPGERDPLFDEIARLICTSSQASTSSLQRRYNIGYNRAGRIMDQLEAAGIVGPAQGGKPRQVLLDSMQIERLLGISE